MTILNHSTLGSLEGIRATEDVVQFLGLQYATLRDGLARGVLHEGLYSEEKRSATRHGPNVINPVDACQREQRLIQGHLPFTELSQSDVDCLTLNISIPHDCIASPDEKLPVLVFVHGGAFSNGSSSHPQYDMARITSRALRMVKPLIAIGVNYRVGLPGFLHSTELEAAGYKPNNGLDDQRLALRWIRQHIRGFGGDPFRVTLAGQSAGAASACFHLQREEPLFHQMIAMGGSSFNGPRPFQRLQKAFDSLASEWGVQGKTPAEEVERLLAAIKEGEVGSLGRKYGVGPMVDGDLILHGATTFCDLAMPGTVTSYFPGIKYCKTIMMGACEADGIVWLNRLSGRSDVLSESLVKNLKIRLKGNDSYLVPQIVKAYGLESEETTSSLVRFGTDISFAIPARMIADAWSSSGVPGAAGHFFQFDCPNPWEGPWKGHATHVLDISFALLNFEDQLSPGQRECGRRFADDLIVFVHDGAASWEMCSQEQSPTRMRYFAAPEDSRDGSGVITDASTSDRAGDLYSLDGRVLDRVFVAWQDFMAGK